MSHFKAKMHQILFPASVRPSVRVKLHLRDRRTDGQKEASLCPSVRLSLRWSLTLSRIKGIINAGKASNMSVKPQRPYPIVIHQIHQLYLKSDKTDNPNIDFRATVKESAKIY